MHPHGPHGMGHGPFQGVSGPPGQMQPPGFGGFGGPPFPGQPGQPGFPGMPGGHPYGLPPPPMGFAPYPPPPFNQQKPDEQLWAPHDSNQGNSSNPAAAPGMNQYSQPPPPQRPPQQQQQQPAQGPQPQKPAEDAPKETRGKNQRDSQKPPQNVKEVTQAIERLDLNESVKVSKDSRPQGKPSTKPDSGEVRPEKRKDLTSGPTERAAPKEPAVKSPNAEVPARSTGPAGGEEQRIAADQAAKPLAKPTEAGEGSAEKEVNDVNGRDGTDSRYEARLPGTGAHLVHSGQRRGRGRGFRGSAPSSRGGRISVPDSDFDFEISNAKFNKTDVANEASANATHDVVVRTEADDDEEDGTEESEDDPSFYQKSSFFDNISCDAKDRAESHDGR
ncbi:uncharacterized protein EV422DRAFT_161489 [Fimicolochytrium jonesii]|uniref:uncharacterized protein n=1 Tax=Fimicolochytrium jonesii TaxID=1396493 RepID=UPI0022FE8EDE|nr:uncharacterized protein EV422DRAFT_161489 [Fimicolochytrium jonesii]KAI8818664.1 hypothetical protein EV422DRAFT_161489 [Fimicolochytrium jonesii]